MLQQGPRKEPRLGNHALCGQGTTKERRSLRECASRSSPAIGGDHLVRVALLDEEKLAVVGKLFFAGIA